MLQRIVFDRLSGGVVSAVVLLALSLPALARLDWDKRSQTIEATVMDQQIRAIYPFTNNGDQAITIRSVKTSCGCTAATLKKRTYLAGEMIFPQDGGH